MLVLIESPYKIRALKACLDKAGIDAEVLATRGRLLDLPQASIGVTSDFTPDGLEPTSPDYFDAIYKALAGAGEVFVATDPDSEGDMIGWTVACLREGKPTYRVYLYDYHTQATQIAFSQAALIGADHPPALARRIFDRLLGYSSADGLFLSRTAGVVLGTAVRGLIPTNKIRSAKLIRGEKYLFNEHYQNQATSILPTMDAATDLAGTLPNFRNYVEVGIDHGATVSEVFDALQTLYTEGEISYFRTSSGGVNDSAKSAILRIAQDFGIDSESKHLITSNAPHPGIYATSSDLMVSSRSRFGGLAALLHEYAFNATLCAASGSPAQTRQTDENGHRWTSISYELRGETYSYPQSCHALQNDVSAGSPFRWTELANLSIPKQTQIALTLMGSGVGHPSSWAALSKNYSCLLDGSGHLSSRGSAFYRKHQTGAPSLLEPEIMRRVEVILMNGNATTKQKIEDALEATNLSIDKLGLDLKPAPGVDVQIAPTYRSP